MALSKDLREYFGSNYAEAYDGYEMRSCILATKGLTAEDLVYKYDKVVTAKVDGEYVGWAGEINFIYFYCNKGKHKREISDITYWGSPNCRFHLMMQFCLQCKDADELMHSDRDNEVFPTKEAKEKYIGSRMGVKLPRLNKPIEIKVNPRYK